MKSFFTTKGHKEFYFPPFSFFKLSMNSLKIHILYILLVFNICPNIRTDFFVFTALFARQKNVSAKADFAIDFLTATCRLLADGRPPADCGTGTKQTNSFIVFERYKLRSAQTCTRRFFFIFNLNSSYFLPSQKFKKLLKVIYISISLFIKIQCEYSYRSLRF